ncbi:MAG TPA: CPBP family intramembrane glutamic endopeptidase, partial [Ktedonobacteraceae bacterium]|nr:CPBP family intramembrane glutamic endopeptidase [Ktedonobacteraceae bacterium]
ILAGLTSLLIPTLHLPQLALQTVGESILVLVSAATFLLARIWIERRPFADLGLSRHHLVRDLLLGFLLGFLLQGATIGILALAGWYHVTSLTSGSVAIVLILQGLGIFLLVALFEEGVFRGIIFRLLERSLGSWIAIILSALFFGLTHLLNPDATLFGALAIALEAGILLGAAYMLTRSLWLAVGFHWAWNFFEGPVFGTVISGSGPSSVKTIITSTMTGPQIWTGGTFGPEAGLVALMACLVAGAILLILAVRRGQVIAPSWSRLTPRRSDHQAQPASQSIEG